MDSYSYSYIGPRAPADELKPGNNLELNPEIRRSMCPQAEISISKNSDVFRDFLAANACFGETDYMNTLQRYFSTSLHKFQVHTG